MGSLKKVTRSISVIFIGCALTPRLATGIVLELCKFHGEYKRIEFGGFRLDEQACRDIFDAICGMWLFRMATSSTFARLPPTDFPGRR
jgi:predicted anti-sigma-YlaC factor YlaD